MRHTHSSLYWKVCVINGAVLTVATLVLVVSPARVSSNVVVSEALVLVVGMAAVLVANAVLLRAALGPVDRVIRAMSTAQLGGPVARLEEGAGGAGTRLVHSYHAMLDRLEHERARSSAKALAAQEAERDRIARELHDQIGQSLTVVLLGLKHVAERAPAEVQEELDLVRDTARSSLDDVRRVARELRPGALDDLGLLAALAALATDVDAYSGPTVRRTFGAGLPTLSKEAELVVYRVAQEALTNAVRHAGAQRVELSLLRVGEVVVLEVVDDGRGFDTGAASTDSVGLLGMADRAALVGGKVEVASAPGRGTMVRLSVPVKPSAPSTGVRAGGPTA